MYSDTTVDFGKVFQIIHEYFGWNVNFKVNLHALSEYIFTCALGLYKAPLFTPSAETVKSLKKKKHSLIAIITHYSLSTSKSRRVHQTASNGRIKILTENCINCSFGLAIIDTDATGAPWFMSAHHFWWTETSGRKFYLSRTLIDRIVWLIQCRDQNWLREISF